jgi:hypothetical protein
MRAAPARACARRVIAQRSPRVRITFALFINTRSPSKVNSALRMWERRRSSGRAAAFASAICDSDADLSGYLLPTTAVTSISSNMPGMASALITRNVLAGIGPSP